MSNFWENFVKLGMATTDVVAQQQKKKGGKRGGKRKGKPECTPCAAQAYVEALRGGPGDG